MHVLSLEAECTLLQGNINNADSGGETDLEGCLTGCWTSQDLDDSLVPVDFAGVVLYLLPTLSPEFV